MVNRSTALYEVMYVLSLFILFLALEIGQQQQQKQLFGFYG
jgi:hypothetical protein